MSILLGPVCHRIRLFKVALAIFAVLFVGLVSPLFNTAELVEVLEERGFEAGPGLVFCPPDGDDESDLHHTGPCHLLFRIVTHASPMVAQVFLWHPLCTPCQIVWQEPLEFQPLERAFFTQAQPRAPPPYFA